MFTSDLVKNIKRDVIVDFMIVSSYGDSQVSSDNVIIKKDIGREIKDHSRNLPYICFIEPSICDNDSFLSS